MPFMVHPQFLMTAAGGDDHRRPGCLVRDGGIIDDRRPVNTRYYPFRTRHLHLLHRRIGATADDSARIQQRFPRISAHKPRFAQTRRREIHVADAMRRLHRRDYAHLPEARL